MLASNMDESILVPNLFESQFFYDTCDDILLVGVALITKCVTIIIMNGSIGKNSVHSYII